jgi:hypothetical protein
LNQWHLKMVLTWNGSRNLHFMGLDWNGLTVLRLLAFLWFLSPQITWDFVFANAFLMILMARRFIGILVLVIQLRFHSRFLCWTNGVFMGANHVNQGSRFIFWWEFFWYSQVRNLSFWPSSEILCRKNRCSWTAVSVSVRFPNNHAGQELGNVKRILNPTAEAEDRSLRFHVAVFQPVPSRIVNSLQSSSLPNKVITVTQPFRPSKQFRQVLVWLWLGLWKPRISPSGLRRWRGTQGFNERIQGFRGRERVCYQYQYGRGGVMRWWRNPGWGLLTK